MKRVMVRIPGFDCMRGPCPSKDCPGRTGNSSKGHGISGEDWRYSIIMPDGLTALSLMVSTSIFPETVPASVVRDPPRGIDLTLHTAFATGDRESVLEKEMHDCDLLPEDRCYTSYSTSLGAREFFDAHGDPSNFDQPERFWQALEERCVKRSAQAHAERVDTKWQRCPHCDGKGTIAISGG